MSPTRSYKYLFNPTTHQQFQLQPLKFHKLKLRGMFNNPWPLNFHIKTFNHVEFKITKNRNSQPTDSPFSSSFVSVALPPHRTPRLPAAPARRLPPPLPRVLGRVEKTLGRQEVAETDLWRSRDHGETMVLRENLQETMVFTIKYRAFLEIFPSSNSMNQPKMEKKELKICGFQQTWKNSWEFARHGKSVFL